MSARSDPVVVAPSAPVAPEPRASADAWLALGGPLVFLLGLQLATGVLLLMHFAPDPTLAFDSLQRIRREVPYGWLVHLTHAHGANLLVVGCVAHLVHVAIVGAYKDSRELQWVTGCALLALTLGAAFTGYVLPWSQLSYWGSTIVSASIDYVPLVGPDLMRWLRGGDVVGPATYRRAFAAHVVGIPVLLACGVALHRALVRRSGRAPALPRSGRADATDPPLSFDERVRRHAVRIVATLVLLFGLIFFAPLVFFPEESFAPADPFDTPPGVHPEWYFLWLYQLPRMVPQRVALVLQTLAALLLVALPWLDRGPARRPRDRPGVMLGLALAGVAIVTLSLLALRR